ncbi:MAG: formate dehydrogenase subunit delta [Burkholderiales bacterium]|nr:formate dehydrogenase subunit delta [Burkholderiales bacterium]
MGLRTLSMQPHLVTMANRIGQFFESYRHRNEKSG